MIMVSLRVEAKTKELGIYEHTQAETLRAD